MCGDQGLMNDLDHIIVIIEVLAHSIRAKGAQNYVVHTVNCVVCVQEIVITPWVLGHGGQVRSVPVREIAVGDNESCGTNAEIL
jgi:hypothetical protein